MDESSSSLKSDRGPGHTYNCSWGDKTDEERIFVVSIWEG
jgi:hypothetical protein